MLIAKCGVLAVIAGAIGISIAGCTMGEKEDPMTSSLSKSGPLAGERIMSFGVTRDAAVCKAFYVGKLGLRLVGEDPYAVVLDSGGTIIRMQKMAAHEPKPYTVLGWQVRDIRATLEWLGGAGVSPERYDWMKEQDSTGVATFPNGDMVAWFKDPEGNVLSVAQLKK